jgi:hypothetical protein
MATNKTDDKTVVVIDIKTLVADAKIKAVDFKASSEFVSGGIGKAGFPVIQKWVQTGKVLKAIKAFTGKDGFQQAITDLYGTKKKMVKGEEKDVPVFNANDRGYCQNLADQNQVALKKWFIAVNQTSTQPVTVWQRFCLDLDNEVVGTRYVKGEAKKKAEKPSQTETQDENGTNRDEKPVDLVSLANNFTDMVRANMENLTIREIKALQAQIAILASVADGTETVA